MRPRSKITSPVGSLLLARFAGTLRPEQRRAAKAVLEHDDGVLSAGTAFGKTVVAANVIAKRGVSVRPRETGFGVAALAADGIQEVYRLLAGDETRNALIVEDVVAAAAAGRSALVLTERTAHRDLLAGLLAERTQHVFALSGGMGVKKRAELAERMAAVPEGESSVLVAIGRWDIAWTRLRIRIPDVLARGGARPDKTRVATRVATRFISRGFATVR